MSLSAGLDTICDKDCVVDSELEDTYVISSTFVSADLMIQNSHILIADDALDIREPLGQYLKKNGFRVSLAADTQAAREMLARGGIDALILDIMMPGEDGLSLCRWVVATTSVPVILLTAMVTDVDKIVGLEIGADDYIVKPFNPRELLARLRVVLRRMQHASSVEPAEVRHVGPWVHNAATGTMTNGEEDYVTLTANENRLLCAFLDDANTVLSRSILVEHVLGRGERAFERTIDNMIVRLRKKIEDDPSAPRLILTDRGRGYRLAVVAAQDTDL